MKKVIILILALILIFSCYYIFTRITYTKTDNIINNQILQKDNELQSRKTEEDVKMSNEVIAKLNGQNIYKEEYDLYSSLNEKNELIDNKLINKENTMKELIKEKIIIEEATKINISVSNDEIETIEKQLQDVEENDLIDYASQTNMEIKDYKDSIIENIKNKKIVEEWKFKIYSDIIDNKIDINYKNFKEKNKEFHKLLEKYNSGELDKIPMSNLYDVFNIYMEYLMEKYDIEVYN